MSEYAYYYELFPPAPTTEWVRFKRVSTGFKIARRWWAQREQMRRDYEAQHGTIRSHWPTRHPGVVLDAVEDVAHPACLGCAWLDADGVSMGVHDWRGQAEESALRHQQSR